MLGAIIGDIVGSIYEFSNYRFKEFALYDKKCFFTDDSIMTLSIAKALLDFDEEYNDLGKLCIKNMQNIGRHYPFSGYGGNFIKGFLAFFIF